MEVLRATLLCNCLRPGERGEGHTHTEELLPHQDVDRLKERLSAEQRIRPDYFMSEWEGRLTSGLKRVWLEYLYPGDGEMDQFWGRVYNVAVGQWRGPEPDSAAILLDMLAPTSCSLLLHTVRQYTEEIVKSAYLCLEDGKHEQFRQWKQIRDKGSTEETDPLITYISCCRLDYSPQLVDVKWMTRWLERGVLARRLLAEVATRAFTLDPPQSGLLPTILGTPLGWTSALRVADGMLLASLLPSDLTSQWRLLYSNQVHGDSFTKLVHQIVDKGPTLFVIQDVNNKVFGGFASQPWAVYPNFYGDDQTFLFLLQPEIRVMPASRFNNHYQYLNIGQHTLKNGLGLGGRRGYCGLWLEPDLRSGRSAQVCSTFRNYNQPSGASHFRIARLEVWALAPSQIHCKRLKNQDPSTILEGTAKTMLELIKL